MLSNSVLATAVLIALARAAPLPLNINLGAYSPALVVGDGAMSFEEANAVTNLVNTLQGAATAGAAAGAAREATTPAAATPAPGAGAGAGAGNAEGAAVANAASTPILTESASLPIAGMGKEKLNRREEEPLQKRQSGFDRALQFAEAALTKGPKVQLGTGKEGAGVGIIVDNNPTAAARKGTGAAAAGTGITVN